MRSALVLSLLLTACIPSALAERIAPLPHDPRCQTSAEDRQWLGEALAGWRTVVGDYLAAPDRRLPQIVVYDDRCSYALAATPASPASWSITEHGGEITLPNGNKIAAGPNAFNATDAGASFVVMSLLSIWRPVAPRSEIPLEWFLEGVLFHELSHAYQSAATPQLSFHAVLNRSMPQLANVSDDSVQEAFAANADYVRDYEAERDLLFQASSASADVEARALVCEGLARLRARRARHFIGANAYWALVDEISLTTEGLGEWVSYKWMTSGRGLAPSLVLSKLRGRYWSQVEGLAIFLAVDRLVPNWQRRLFSTPPATAEQLLALACGR